MSTPLLQDPSLTWGQLEFVAPGVETDATFDIEAMDGTQLGNPVPIIETLPSLLVEGALAQITGWENREIPIRLRISANDGESLAEAEAALFQQVLLEQPDPLVWTSPLDLSAPVVFDVVVAKLERDNDAGWDLREKLLGYRYFLLTLTCLPFARAVESTLVPALPLPADPDTAVWVDVDPAGSTTGWSRETNGSSPSGPTTGTAGGETYVQVAASISSASQYLRLTRTGSIAVPADHYLAVDVELDDGSGIGSVVGTWKARYDGTTVGHAPVAIVPGLGEGGTTRLYFADVGTITALTVLYDFTTVPLLGIAARVCTLRVFNVAYTDTIGSSTISTPRQQTRIVSVAGAAPTRAALRFYRVDTDELGSDSLIYTGRSTTFLPNLRQWIDTSEAPTSDSAMVSGARQTLATPTVYLIPAALFAAGTYALMARMDVDVAGTLTWTAQIADDVGATTEIGSSIVLSGEIDLEVTSDYQVLDLGAPILPPVELATDDRTVRLSLSGTSNMKLDETWLFNIDDGALTWVKDTTGKLTWIEARSPELGAARPSVWGGQGDLGEGATCIDYACESFGEHRFEPGEMQIFTVSTLSVETQAEIEFFRRFHSHVWGVETS